MPVPHGQHTPNTEAAHGGQSLQAQGHTAISVASGAAQRLKAKPDTPTSKQHHGS